MSTYRELYERGKTYLETKNIVDANLDALLLLEYVCHTYRHDFIVHGDKVIEEQQAMEYWDDILRRGEHVPLQYITGEQEFMGKVYSVSKDVLIPRQDTEFLVEEVLKFLHDGMHVLDMCTGSGCILISLLSYSNDCLGVGVDFSLKALEIAEKNGIAILNKEERRSLRWIQSDLFEKVNEKFDVIVSNPPYIETSVIETLMEEVKDYEPLLALDGSKDGLEFYRRIIKEGPLYLNRGGMLFFEIGYNQAKSVSTLMKERGFHDVNCIKDYAGNDRVVFGTFY